ncbi:MAG TPA: hypothetical protein VL614_10715 [Acetobacteraceae bacterium]|jgi:hypothetical protein|nr:hypothetical protein [Acetobacteraceae bacterium]
MESAIDEGRSVYPALAALLGDDVCRVSLVLCVFHHVVNNDLRQMEHAAVAGRWAQVRQLAHRAVWGCRFIGEEGAADALATVERAAHDAADRDSLARTFWDAHKALVAVLDRAAAYAGLHVKDRSG